MAQADCPQCRGSGWKLVERDAAARDAFGRDGDTKLFGPFARLMAVPCDCLAGNRTARLLERARIPRRYEHCDFENFEFDLYENEPRAPAWNLSLKEAKLVAQSFAHDFPVSGYFGLLLMGPCGIGKTHLAVAALKEVVLRGHQGLFYDYRELLKEIQACYNPESPFSEMEVLEPVLSAELLLLDDVGASKPSVWALETVGHILGVRYNENRTTLITTNYLDAPVAPCDAATAPPPLRDDTLADRVGHRIRSRLYEMCRTVEIVAPDFRKRIRQAWQLHP